MKKKRIIWISLYIICLAVVYFSFKHAKNKSYEKGLLDGYYFAMDTVINIMHSTDNVVSKLIIESDRDTVGYYLSPKTVLKNPK